MSTVLVFGPFELDTGRGELRRFGTPVRLRRQAVQALSALASRPSEVVTREELRQLLWGDHTFVDFKEGLNTCIKQVRETLGDDAVHPLYVETVPRQGYRFVAPVERARAEARESAPSEMPGRLSAAPPSDGRDATP